MTKAELETELAKVREENAKLRELIAAVRAAADIPRPASWGDENYEAMRQLAVDRCIDISIWLADLDHDGEVERTIRLFRNRITPCKYETEETAAAV